MIPIFHIRDEIVSQGGDRGGAGHPAGRFSLEQQQLTEWILETIDKPIVHVILGVPFDYYQTQGRVAAAAALMGSRSVMVEAGADYLYGKIEALGTMHFDLTDGQGGDYDALEGEEVEEPVEDRCVEQGLDCSDRGICTTNPENLVVPRRNS